MGYGGSLNGRLLRVLLLGAAAGAACAVVAAVTLLVLRDRSQHALEQRARRELARGAQLVRTELLASPATSGSELRRVAERTDGVQVLRVAGDDRQAPNGVRLLFRVQVAKVAPTLFGYQRAAAVACFTQLVDSRAVPEALDEVSCPPGLPQPALSGDAEALLRAALSSAAAMSATDERSIRAVVSELHFGATVRTEVHTENGTVGVGVREGTTCLLGQVGPAGVRVWRVTPAQVRRGELSCTAHEAATGAGAPA